MDLRQLKYFLGVCEHGSIAKAARAMHIAQPALSRQMAQLEEALDSPLFFRLPRGIALTRSGEELKTRASALLAQAGELEQQLRFAAQGRTGSLRIGVMPGYSWLPALSAAAQRLHAEAPGIHVQLEMQHSAVLLERLRAHALDAVVTSWRSPHDPAFQGWPVLQDPLVAAVPADYAASLPQRRWNLADLQAQPLVMFPRERSPLHYDSLMAAFASAGFVPQKAAISVADIPTALGLVASGFGWSMAPQSNSKQWRESVVFQAIEGIHISLSIELVWRRADPDPVLSQFLAAWRQGLQAR